MLRQALTRLLSEFLVEKPQPEPKAPERGLFVSGVRDDYSIEVGDRRLTPQRLGDLMRGADQGETRSLYECFEEIERDPQISRLLFRRRSLVCGAELTISAPADADPKAEQAAELCRQLILGGKGKDGISDLGQGLYDLTDAIGKAVAVSQIVWDLDGGTWAPKRLVRWPQQELIFGTPAGAGRYQQDEDDLRIACEEARVEGKRLSDFPAGTWIVHRQKAWSQPLARAALMRSVAWYFLFKRFGIRDWSIFLERFGIPPRIGKYAPGADDAARSALWSAVRSLGKDHAAIMPDTASIEIIETKASSSAAGSPHKELASYCDDQIAVAIMGSTMATTQGDRGARSAKEAFSVEEYEQLQLDASNLASTIRTQLCGPIVRYNLGPDAPLPDVRFALDDGEDLDIRSQVDERVAALGFPLTAGYISDKYKIPLAPGVERDQVLEQAKPAAPAPFSELSDSKKKSLDWLNARKASRAASKPS